ncbi:TniQ family protein [Paucibacter sp. PLA-PC-4]|uniref:TniQ family protein n=1 Tax=Paucibacter sp. PLA-PC-4 TaxID=2993655 RepID=UPI00224A4D58|nr:TniQ family protein [Paucibacter sp. PLA-PC-4]MCX2864303.1 TniQ family protein [Paucibacter sp. PLA-PC-4]
MLIKLHQLTNVPAAMPDESPTSWLSRAALHQGVGITEFLRFLGVRYFSGGDLDLEFVDWFGQHLASLPALAGLRAAVHMAGFARRAGSSSVLRPLYERAGTRTLPFSRFCAPCLHDATTLYFPVHWRFDEWRYCPAHDCLLEDACPNCSIPARLPVGLFSKQGAGGRHISLAHCRSCGASLMNLPPVTLRQAKQVGLLDEDVQILVAVQGLIGNLARTGHSCTDLDWATGVVGTHGTSRFSRIKMICVNEARRRLGVWRDHQQRFPFPVAMPMSLPSSTSE